MGEFELIRRYFLPLSKAGRNSAVIVSSGDDCAIQRVGAGKDLVFSIDTLVEGVHFPAGYSPERLGWRSLAVAASDLAAMGAEPVCFTLAMTLPEADPEWLAAFSSGLSTAAARFGLDLVGGDITRGPLTLSLQVHGTVPADGAIKRSGAKPGDLICVSGTLGNAGAALAILDLQAPGAWQSELLSHYHNPQPRLALGCALRGKASAAVDISDGLVADLRHLLDASGAGGEIDIECLPLSDALIAERADAKELALYAGDDYELCITLPEAAFEALSSDIRNQITVIGRVHEGEGLVFKGEKAPVRHRGYDHFGSG